MDDITGWFEILGQIFATLSVAATLTPTKKDDKIFTKIEGVGSALNVVGFDLKAVVFGIAKLFGKKK